jgi:hypothetical protein
MVGGMVPALAAAMATCTTKQIDFVSEAPRHDELDLLTVLPLMAPEDDSRTNLAGPLLVCLDIIADFVVTDGGEIAPVTPVTPVTPVAAPCVG